MEVHLKLGEGYHGTVFENLEQGLDREKGVYDKSKVKKARYPQIDLAASIDQAVQFAYYVAFRTVEHDYTDKEAYEKARELAVLVQGTRLSETSIKVEKIFKLKVSELDWMFLRIPTAKILEDITDQFLK